MEHMRFGVLPQTPTNFDCHPQAPILINMDFNLQSLSLEDTTADTAAASASSIQWKLDPDFTAQIDRVGRLLVVEDITDAILEISGLLEIFSFRRTCRLGRRAVDNYNSRAFNVNRNLLRFFDDPVSFRSLQERTDTLISGSFALALLDRTIYPDSDLDLYTHPGFAPAVSEWMYAEGYRLVRRDRNGKIIDDTTGFSLNWRENVVDNWRGLQPPYGSRLETGGHSELVLYDGWSQDVHDVYTWQKLRRGHVRIVDVVSCKRCPLATVLRFHSSQQPYPIRIYHSFMAPSSCRAKFHISPRHILAIPDGYLCPSARSCFETTRYSKR